MAQCVVAAPDGSLHLGTVDPCTTFVVLTPAEYAAVSMNPFNLTVEDGAQIALLIVGVWVTAFIVRALIRALSGGHTYEPGDGSF